MKKTLYHLTGASLIVFVWRVILWLFAWPLALWGKLRRRHKQEYREIMAAVQASTPEVSDLAMTKIPTTPEGWAALAEQKEREAETASPLIRHILLMQATGARRRAS